MPHTLEIGTVKYRAPPSLTSMTKASSSSSWKWPPTYTWLRSAPPLSAEWARWKRFGRPIVIPFDRPWLKSANLCMYSAVRWACSSSVSGGVDGGGPRRTISSQLGSSAPQSSMTSRM